MIVFMRTHSGVCLFYGVACSLYVFMHWGQARLAGLPFTCGSPTLDQEEAGLGQLQP